MNGISVDDLKSADLSDLVLNVLNDIKKAQASGIKMDMSVWAETKEENYGGKGKIYTKDDRDNICTACLGGMAVCGLLPQPPKQEDYDQILSNSIVDNYQSMFDQLRDGIMYDFATYAALVKFPPPLKGKDYDKEEREELRNYLAGYMLSFYILYKGQKRFKGKISYTSRKFENLVAYIKAVGQHLKKGGY